MIDVSTIGHETLTDKNILKHISEYDIFYHYHGEFTIGKLISSPFRVDSHPSFGIYISKTNGRLCYNDFREGGGNVFSYIQRKYGCNYIQSLKLINRDFNLNLIDTTINNSKYFIKDISEINTKPVVTNFKPKKKSDVKISISVRRWIKERDGKYWNSKYFISLKTLSFFNVYPITRFYLDDQLMYSHKYSYAYYFRPGVFKIYQPKLTNMSGKWYSNIDTNLPWQGYDQLPENDDILFITSSMKDVMVLYELGYSAIAPHTESQNLSKEMYEQLSKRFKEIIIYYDNDEAGVLHSIKLTNTYNFKYINNPKNTPKDPSDYIEKYKSDSLKKLIIKELKKKNINV